jgi:hypothetical protein
MKKLLSIICSVLCIHSIFQSPDINANTTKISGEKVLMKAIAGIVNPQGNKKAPAKITTLSSIESL